VPVLWTLTELVAAAATRIAALPAPKNGQVRAIPDERTVRYYATLGLLDRPAMMRGRTALYGARHAAQVVAIKRLQTMGRSLAEIQQLWPTLDDAALERMSGVEFPAAPRTSGRNSFWKRAPASDAVVGGRGGGAVGAGGVGEGGDAGAAGVRGGDDGAAAGGAERGGDDGAAAGGAERGGDDGAAAGGAERGGGAAGAAAVSDRGGLGSARGALELRVELAPGVVLSLSHFEESAAVSLADVRAIRAAAAPLLAELVSRRLAPHADREGAT